MAARMIGQLNVRWNEDEQFASLEKSLRKRSLPKAARIATHEVPSRIRFASSEAACSHNSSQRMGQNILLRFQSLLFAKPSLTPSVLLRISSSYYCIASPRTNTSFTLQDDLMQLATAM
jgi:hypothetical protein